MDNNVEKTSELIEGANEVVAFDSGITSGKMFKGTKELFKALELGKGNEQERFKALVEGYKEMLEYARTVVKVESPISFDISNKTSDVYKAIDAFVKGIEADVSQYVSNSIIAKTEGAETEFNQLHNGFMRYLEDVEMKQKELDKECTEKNAELEYLKTTVETLKNTLEQAQEKEKESTSKAVKLEDKNEKLESENKKLNHNLENTKSMKLSVDEKNYRLKQDKEELSKELTSKKEEIEFLAIKIDRMKEEVSTNTALLAEVKVKNETLIEENKELISLKEQVLELKASNELLKKESGDVKAIKIRNVELEGTVKALESQKSIIETTLTTINSTMNAVVESKMNAEERAMKAEKEVAEIQVENKKMQDEIERLKEELNKDK